MKSSHLVLTTLFFLILFYASPVIGQNDSTGFDLSKFSWLSGYWIGDGFGGISEEYWSVPSSGSIIGLYKHYKDGKVTFYELMSMAEHEGKFSLRLKHFNQNMTGWEEKDDFVDFPFVGATDKRIDFKGLVYELMSENEMEVRLKLKQGDKIHTEVFHFTRKDIP